MNVLFFSQLNEISQTHKNEEFKLRKELQSDQNVKLQTSKFKRKNSQMTHFDNHLKVWFLEPLHMFLVNKQKLKMIHTIKQIICSNLFNSKEKKRNLNLGNKIRTFIFWQTKYFESLHIDNFPKTKIPCSTCF